jgi:polysaccharide pyruvyl transferase WcaK-like protein/glycosyltransferase involved in cell wall biosynthesis
MTNIKHVGILNAYDARNRGDRAIVEAQLGWIERTMPGASVTIFSPHHEYNQTIFRSTSCQAPLFGIPRRGNFIGRLMQPVVDMAKHWLGARTDSSSVEFHSCDAFFVCGGGYLYSSPSPLVSRQLFLHAANILAALKTGKPVLSFPMSWGPIRKKADKLICKRLASSMPILVTRGAESNELLETWGFKNKVFALPDVVLAAAELLPGLKVWRETPRRTGSLGIAPIDWSFDRKVSPKDMDSYLSKLVTLGKEWCKREGRSITVFPQVEVDGSDDDRIVARRLITRLRDAGLTCQIAEDLDWSDYWKEIAAQEVFVGCRMHSCIFAMACGVPTVGLGYQSKFKELFEQLGWPDRSHLIDSFSPGDVAAQLKTLSTGFDRQEMLKHIDHVGRDLLKAMDEAWLRTVESCSLGKSWAAPRNLKFSIVTPSYKQIDLLKCCAASVADQVGDFEVEHLIHDGGSGEEFNQWAKQHKTANCISEKDDGMYDAINRGFRRAEGDIIAWLNCDEQYLPGTLEKVSRFFDSHPEIDVLFGDVVLVNELMTPLAYRRAIKPSIAHTRHSHLSTFSASTFIRRRILDEGHFLQNRWKTIADAVWIEELLSAGYRSATIQKPLSVFCMLGSNLGQSPLLFEERKQWEIELKSTSIWVKRWYIMLHRTKKFLSGAYNLRKTRISAFLPDTSSRITKSAWLTGYWRFAKYKSQNLRAQREESIGMLKTQRMASRWSFLHAICVIILAVFVDKMQPGDAVKGPAILLFSLLYLSFRVKIKDLTLISSLYAVIAFYLLSERPPDVLAARMITFSIGICLAILFSKAHSNLSEWMGSTVSLVRKIPLPILLTDRTGMIILVNNNALKLWQLAEEDCLKHFLMVQLIDDGIASTKPTLIDSWAERPPDGDLRISINGKTEIKHMMGKVLVTGGGRRRFYVFILSH